MAKLKLSKSQRRLLAVTSDHEWTKVPKRFQCTTAEALVKKGLLFYGPLSQGKSNVIYKVMRVKISELLKTSELLARQFHRYYEDLAPKFGYKTRKASAVPWSKVPKNNRGLMIAVCKKLLGESGLIAWIGP